MVHIVWTFTPRPERVAEFEAAYGPQGDWTRLFASSPEYRGTTLARDVHDPGRYLLFDAWTSLEAFARFKAEHADAYRALDVACEALTVNEHHVGDFAVLG